MRSIWRTLGGRLLRDIGLVCLAVGVIGVSYGAIAVTTGFPLWFPVLAGALVLAGASELLFVGIVAAGGNPLAAMAAGLLVNARHLPFGLAIPEAVGHGWRRGLGAHVMNDESVTFALAQHDPARRRAAFWACGLGVLACWPLGALLGALLGQVVRNTDSLGLDATFPAVILALVFPALRERRTLVAALLGAALALATTPLLPPGLPVLVALLGLVAWVGRAEPEPTP